ncbi:cation diffusion facilitator family transporter [Sporolactobacillus laevolacticus]|uniref:cation diffusion facilitator family transporter n=1 Tax=Sporolactobacillus laevolacticus TaxID=33018 RepID=UPI0025B54D4E|nr:cation diffusion facilitator family transporter [Sporolactobacillus laevolacticus]MDN3954631.1 cation diffusion facilitator family transporter [Sporolactobacillus laevolacticus]
MIQDKYLNLKLSERGAIISIAAYLCLSVLKLFIGFTMESRALRADGFNNVTDIVASVAVLIGLRLSQRPADSDHPYGHWKSETIASLFASFVMMAVGIQVLFDGGKSLIAGHEETPDILSAWIGLFCAVVMFAVYRYNKNLSMKTNSASVMAAAKDNLSDAWVSVGASVGIFGSQLHLSWLDSVIALLIGLLICKTAWDIFRESSYNLSDGFDDTLLDSFNRIVLSVKGVEGVRDIRGRTYGNNMVIDLVILVDPNMGLKEAHKISSQVEDVLMEKYDVFDVHVHVEPSEKS